MVLILLLQIYIDRKRAIFISYCHYQQVCKITLTAVQTPMKDHPKFTVSEAAKGGLTQCVTF